LQSETRHLAQALRRPEVRGQWGELTLKRLAELAGMSEHCDFFEQESLQSDTGLVRPDMIVRLSDSREIVIDAKTPLDAYLSAVETPDEAQRKRQLQRHARNVRERVRELSGKHYWRHLPGSPEFVVLFIPGDQFLSSALQQDPGLLEDALAGKVMLATPTSLVALLRTLAYGWRQQVLAENAEAIRRTGEEMYDRLLTFSEHMSRVGRSLTGSVDAFNKAVGSFDNRVLPSVRRFTEMGVRAKREVENLSQIETLPRTVESDVEARTENA
jgi:DNA recombination protein RmuC